MKRRLALLLLTATACGGMPPPQAKPQPAVSTPPPIAAEDAEALACDGTIQALDAAPADDSLRSAFETPVGTIGSIRVEASSAELESRARKLVQLSVGASLSDDAIRADVQRLWTLGGLEDVQVRSSGSDHALEVTYLIKTAPAIRSTFHRSEHSGGDPIAEQLGLVPGARYEPGALASGLARARESLFARGYREANVSVTGRRLNDGRVDVCVHVSPGRKLLLHSVSITGNAAVPTADLAALVAALPGSPLNDAELERDVLKMQALYFDRGFVTTEVAPPEIKVTDNALRVHIAIKEGPAFKIGSIRVSGDLVTTKSAYLKRLTVKPGDVFNRTQFASDLERLRTLHREQNAADTDIEPETTLDAKKKSVSIVLRVRARPAKP